MHDATTNQLSTRMRNNIERTHSLIASGCYSVALEQLADTFEQLDRLRYALEDKIAANVADARREQLAE